MRGADHSPEGPNATGAEPSSLARSETSTGGLWTAELYRLHADAEGMHWWFRARRRILTRITHRILGDARATVVDVGCGTGGNIAALAGSYSCIGIDPAADAIELARERHPSVEFIAGDAPEDLPARGRDADLFVLSDVLEHLDDDRGLLSAIVKGSRPGAHLLITVPADPSLWGRHDVTLGHRRRYDMASLSALWDGLPVTVRLLSAFNARLFAAVKTARMLGRLRGRSIGACGTDITVPRRPLNAFLERVFAGESTRLIAALDRRRIPYRRGSSLIAVLRRGC